MEKQNDIDSSILDTLIKSEKSLKKFNSHYEAYGVIKEDLEDAVEEINRANSYFEAYWIDCKENGEKLIHLEQFKHSVLFAINDLMQTAAMAEKAIRFVKDGISI